MPIKIDSRGVELVRTFSIHIETFGEGTEIQNSGTRMQMVLENAVRIRKYCQKSWKPFFPHLFLFCVFYSSLSLPTLSCLVYMIKVGPVMVTVSPPFKNQARLGFVGPRSD